jgi:hypothetical protein
MEFQRLRFQSGEENHYARWESSGFFAPRSTKIRTPSRSRSSSASECDGTLHMATRCSTLDGCAHALEAHARHRTVFLVGVDHAGISTQLMVTRQLKKIGTRIHRTSAAKRLQKRFGSGRTSTAVRITDRSVAEGFVRRLDARAFHDGRKSFACGFAKFSFVSTRKAGSIAGRAS